ncbi:MAG: hypothetical protein ACR2LK_03115 [Solirubrobacteraceae bacterium]
MDVPAAASMEQRRRTARQRDELAFLGRSRSVILLECASPGELPIERVRSELLPKAWRTWVLDPDGRVQRTRLELGL